MAEHVTINHGQRRSCTLSVRERSCPDGAGGHISTAEGFIGLFRWSVQGIWHWVSRRHLDAYTIECTWRHDRRDFSVVTKFIQALGGMDAGPLGYRELVACG
jgi:hypothetical protein